MLEQLFGSKTRVKLLHLFLNDPRQPRYLRQIARQVKSQLNSVRREVANLEKLGIISTVELTEEEQAAASQTNKKGKGKSQGSKKYFLVNTHFLLYPELKALLLKSQILLEQNLIRKIEALPKLKLLVLTGSFVGYENFLTDMLVVGSVDKKKLAGLVKKFERELSRPINYTVMTAAEYKYRQDITDRFMVGILEASKIVVVDKLSEGD